MTESAPKHLWFVRTDKKNTKFFNAEIAKGILRQGWGHSPEHNLRLHAEHGNAKKLGEASRNLKMLNVKKGDWLFAVNLPTYGRCTVLKATEDFRASYIYEPDPVLGDFGHQFKIEKIFDFSLKAKAVSSNIKGTTRNAGRFWNGNKYIEDAFELYELSEGEGSAQLQTKSSKKERLEHAVNTAIEGTALDPLNQSFFGELNKMFGKAEWEYVLVQVFKTLYPNYLVESVGGRTEKEHGIDILITIPNPLAQDKDENFLIAIQVKDYTGKTGNKAEKQAGKVKDYEGFVGRLVETWVIFIGIDLDNVGSDCGDIRIMGKKELSQILLKYLLIRASQ